MALMIATRMMKSSYKIFCVFSGLVCKTDIISYLLDLNQGYLTYLFLLNFTINRTNIKNCQRDVMNSTEKYLHSHSRQIIASQICTKRNTLIHLTLVIPNSPSKAI
jgi:hypothetical protein